MANEYLFISSASKLSLKNDQLIFRTEEEKNVDLTGVSTIVIEHSHVNISSSLLSYCSQNGITVFFCDNRYNLCGVLTGQNSKDKNLKILQAQFGIKEPLRKRLWQQIIVQKITNQANVLSVLGKYGAKSISGLTKMVKLNDFDDVESMANTQYVKHLYGKNAPHGEDSIINKRINYAYTVIRGYIQKCIMAEGIEPMLGLHHNGATNLFNLADDLIEPLRPIIDLYIANMPEGEGNELSAADRQQLFNILKFKVLCLKKETSVEEYIKKCVYSLRLSYFYEKNQIILCEVIDKSKKTGKWDS